MRTSILVLLFTLIPALSHAQKWIKKSLRDRVYVNFPSEPDVQEFANVDLFHIDGPGYMINVYATDISIDSDFEVKPDSLQAFYYRIINGNLKAAGNSKLLKESKIKLGKYEGLEIEYTRALLENDEVRVKSRIILVDKILVEFTVLDVAGKGQEELISKFFKSIRLK